MATIVHSLENNLKAKLLLMSNQLYRNRTRPSVKMLRQRRSRPFDTTVFETRFPQALHLSRQIMRNVGASLSLASMAATTGGIHRCITRVQPPYCGPRWNFRRNNDVCSDYECQLKPVATANKLKDAKPGTKMMLSLLAVWGVATGRANIFVGASNTLSDFGTLCTINRQNANNIAQTTFRTFIKAGVN